jgi:hypothetical protein
MAQPKEFWALTLNLAKSEEGPTIMPASDLFQYKPGRKCFRFKPKSATLKDKFEEFGVVTDLLGGEKLVRHHIIALNGK